MISREEAYARLAVDPTHRALLRRLAEGWNGRKIVHVRTAATPKMLARSDCAPYVERVTRGNLERKLSEEGAEFVVGYRIRWYAARELDDLDAASFPRSSAFPDRAALARWAGHAHEHRNIAVFNVAVCEAEAVAIPALPAHEYLAVNPDGSYEQRPGVA